MGFDTIFLRITSTTTIKNQSQLADFLGIKPPQVSKQRNKDSFPLDWAFRIASEFDLSTDWIMTGKKKGSVANDKSKDAFTFEVIADLNQWLTELVVNEPTRRDWFSHEIQDKLPMFKEWKKRRDQAKGKGDETPRSHIA